MEFVKKSLYHYFVVKYIEDQIKNEPKNIGIIAIDFDNESSASVFPEDKIINKIGQEKWDNIKQIVQHYNKHRPMSIEEMKRWADTKGGEIQFSDVMAFCLENVGGDLLKEISYLNETFI